MRLKHMSPRTEQAYLHWMRRFFAFHGQVHPRDLGEREIEAFLSSLATEGKVAASTQSQALAALLFLYRGVLERDLTCVEGVVRAKRPKHLPVVLTRDELAAVLTAMSGVTRLMAMLLHGGGLRLRESWTRTLRAYTAT
jgi:integrase